MKYKAVFFDFDGTLMDTSEGIFAGGVYAMEKVGLPPVPIIDRRRFIGPPLHDCFRILYGVEDKQTLDALVREYRVYYHKEGRFLASFYPGIVEVLKALKEKGYLLAVATMKNEDLATEMCDHFGILKYFNHILGLNLAGTNSKADVLRLGFELMNLRPEDCVLVGDTEIDAKGAAEAGCDCIRASWGFGFVPGDPGTIDNPLDVLKLV